MCTKRTIKGTSKNCGPIRGKIFYLEVLSRPSLQHGTLEKVLLQGPCMLGQVYTYILNIWPLCGTELMSHV